MKIRVAGKAFIIFDSQEHVNIYRESILKNIKNSQLLPKISAGSIQEVVTLDLKPALRIEIVSIAYRKNINAKKRDFRTIIINLPIKPGVKFIYF